MADTTNIQKPDPLRAFRFLVEIEADGQKPIAAAFTQFSGVKMQVETVKVRTGAEHRGVMSGVPALTSFQNVTLKRGVIGDNEFLQWILSVGPGSTRSATGGSGRRRTINVVAVDEYGRRAVTWSLINAMPVAYELDGMDSMNSEVLSETLEFSIGGFIREVLPKE